MRHPNVLILCLLVAFPASAQIYQWKDAQGRTHYSDTPPPTEPVKTLQAKPRAPIVPNEETPPAAEAGAETQAGEAAAEEKKPAEGKAEAAKPQTAAEKDAEFRKRRAAEAEAADKAAKERQRAEDMRRSCDQARGQLAALQNSRRVTRYNASGEREFLDDSARAAELERTQKYIADNCK